MLGLLGLGGAELVLGSSSEAGAAPAGRRKEMSLSTRLTREYGVRYPFVGAGMGFVGMPDLVAAVSNAGGIGVLGNAAEPPEGTQLLIQAIRARTTNLFGVDFIFDDSAWGPHD